MVEIRLLSALLRGLAVLLLVALVQAPNLALANGEANAGKFRVPADLNGKRIADLIGGGMDEYLATEFPDSTVQLYPSIGDVIAAVKYGKADAGTMDTPGVAELLRVDPAFGAIEGEVNTQLDAAGFDKRKPELRKQFNEFLAQIRQNGVYDQMVERWFKKVGSVIPPIAGSQGQAGKEELVVGTVLFGLPYVHYQDNELTGFDIELMQRFGASLGRKVRFSVMDSAVLVPELVTGKVDAITGIFITKEKAQRIDFSDPYFTFGNQFFVLKTNLAGAENGLLDAPSGEAGMPASEGPFWSRMAENVHDNIIQEKRYLLIAEGLAITILVSIASALLGTALGGVVCAMNLSGKALLEVSARVYIAVLRGTPVLVLLMLLLYVVFASVRISPLVVAIIAFGMNFGAYFSEIFRSGISAIDAGQREAGLAMGFTKTQTFTYILLPQTISRILPVYKGELISLVKMTSVVGYVAVMDLNKAADIIRSRTFDAFTPLIIISVLYFAVSWLLLLALEYLERRTDPAQRLAAMRSH